MRTYEMNSPQAAGRILALMMVVDGNLASAELQAMHRSKILEHIDLAPATFQQLLQDLCDDMLTSTVHGAVQLANGVIDSLLDEIDDPDSAPQAAASHVEDRRCGRLAGRWRSRVAGPRQRGMVGGNEFPRAWCLMHIKPPCAPWQ